jgi:hypothetical protein
MLGQLLGGSFVATLGVPSQVNPTGAQTGASIGGGLGQILAMLGGGGNMIPGGQGGQFGPASQYHF